MIELAYASFGRQRPAGLSGPRLAAVWLLCALFIVWGLALAAVLNAVGLLAGTTIRLIGRDGVEYRFFRLVGRTRAILVGTPILFCFFAWREAQAIGLFGALWPIFAVLALAALLLGLCALLGRAQTGR